jgi:hypothetical protein
MNGTSEGISLRRAMAYLFSIGLGVPFLCLFVAITLINTLLR